jgi:hypothetical protein
MATTKDVPRLLRQFIEAPCLVLKPSADNVRILVAERTEVNAAYRAV